MTVYEAMRVLEETGSTYDPVRYKGRYTTPRSVTDHMNSLDDAKGVRLGYWGGNPLRKILQGTLQGMAKDRARYAGGVG